MDKDHDNPGEKFKQYYYDVDQNYKPGGPMIIDIAGESDGFSPGGYYDPTDPSHRTKSFLYLFAERLHGRVFTLQHRFFGESQPYAQTTVENLKKLTVDQALRDYVDFRDYIMKTENLPSNTTWIAVGGSYSGLLSAFLRKRFPAKFNASLSSSGVVLAIDDYTDFDHQDAISMGHECAAAARHTRIQIDKLLDTEPEFILNAFGLNSTFEKENFRYVVGEFFTLALQYGSLAQICGPLVDAARTGSDPVMALANLVRSDFGKGQFGNLWDYSDKVMQDTTAGLGHAARAWLWMTCNEVAYWQTGAGRTSLRSNKVTKEFFRNQCHNVFAPEIEPNVTAFNLKYGGLDYSEIDKIYFTTGSQDPWTWACVTEEVETVHKNNVVKTIAGPEIGHCSDLGTPKPTDPIDLVRTREHILNTFEKWITPENK